MGAKSTFRRWGGEEERGAADGLGFVVESVVAGMESKKPAFAGAEKNRLPTPKSGKAAVLNTPTKCVANDRLAALLFFAKKKLSKIFLREIRRRVPLPRALRR